MIADARSAARSLGTPSTLPVGETSTVPVGLSRQVDGECRGQMSPGRVLELAEALRVRTPVAEALRVLQE